MRLSPALIWTRVLKPRLPTSLWGRALLIIVLPIALMQVAVTWAFFDAHWETTTARLSDDLAADVAWVVQIYEQDPRPAALRQLADRAERTLQLSIALQEGRRLPVHRRAAAFAPLDRILGRALDEHIDQPVWFETTRYAGYVDIRVQTPHGVLRILAPRERAFASRGHIFILWLGGATILLTAMSVLFIRNQVRAIERLAAAAQAFGRGVEAPDFKPHGAKEVREAASAFIDMRARIQRHIEQRTALLASVSHDLRTPLTRLKLELALAEPSSRTAEMKRDLAEMEHMIDEYLAFARGQAGEAVERVDLRALMEEVAEGARRAGTHVEVETDLNLEAEIRPSALKRALSNLIMNAAAHADHVRAAARALPSGGIEIAVDDDGPGIPPERYEEAFKPFSRLDDARNQNHNGVGLGLAIARDVARGHGGDVVLARSALGGLSAVVRLPQ